MSKWKKNKYIDTCVQCNKEVRILSGFVVKHKDSKNFKVIHTACYFKNGLPDDYL